MSVCPSVRMEQLGATLTGFREILLKYIEKIQLSLK